MRRAMFALLGLLGCTQHHVKVTAPVIVAAGVQWNVRATERLHHLLDLPQGALLVGDYGERWLVPRPLPGTYDPIAGTSATTFLPPDVVGGFYRDTGVVFVTAGGARYQAKGPLDEVTLIATAPGEMRVLAVSQKAILAVGQNKLVQSRDEGLTWVAAKVPALDAPIEQIALTSAGRGLAVVGRPEKILFTDDHGASWRWITARSKVSNVFVKNDGLYADWFLLEGEDNWRYDKDAGRYFAANLDRAPLGWLNTEADRVDRGYAALTEEYVYELWSDDESKKGPWQLALLRRRFGGSPSTTIANMSCEEVSVAARGSTVEYLCVRDGRGLLRRSEDSGNTWFDDEVLKIAEPDDPVPFGGWRANAPIDDHRIYLGDHRAMMVAHACPESGTCTTAGMVRVAGSNVFEPIKVNFRHARFGAVAFAGSRVYAVGTVGGAGRIGAIFQSADGGRSFHHYTVRLEQGGFYDTSLFAPDRGSLVLNAQGDLIRAVVVEGATRYGVFERIGEKWTSLRTPGVPSFAGQRGFAGRSETNDGGKTWHAMKGPYGHATCTAVGCLVGSNDRVGWGLVEPK